MFGGARGKRTGAHIVPRAEVGFQPASDPTAHSDRINWRRRRRARQGRYQNTAGTAKNGSGRSSQYHCMASRKVAEATVGSMTKMMIDVITLKLTPMPMKVQSAALPPSSSPTSPV